MNFAEEPLRELPSQALALEVDLNGKVPNAANARPDRDLLKVADLKSVRRTKPHIVDAVQPKAGAHFQAVRQSIGSLKFCDSSLTVATQGGDDDLELSSGRLMFGRPKSFEHIWVRAG